MHPDTSQRRLANPFAISPLNVEEKEQCSETVEAWVFASGQTISLLCVFPTWAAITNPADCMARTAEINFLTALEAASPKSKCWPVWFLWGFSPWLADGGLLAVSSHGLFSVGAFVSLLKETPVLLD